MLLIPQEHRLQESQARAEKAELEAEKAIEQQKLAAESVENAQKAVSKSVNRESMFSSQVEAMTERVSQLEAELEAWKGREQKACTEADNARSRVREYEDKLSYLRHQLEVSTIDCSVAWPLGDDASGGAGEGPRAAAFNGSQQHQAAH